MKTVDVYAEILLRKDKTGEYFAEVDSEIITTICFNRKRMLIVFLQVLFKMI